MGVITTTMQGEVEGLEVHGLCVFKGIPFAAPPVGNLRWRAPQPPATWEGVRPAHAFGPNCPQEVLPLDMKIMEVPGPQDEDCLYLNVWTPGCDDAKRPVMVWIHGGGLGLGSASQLLYEGQHLARRDVVVVTINYRLGALGFLNLNEVTNGRIPATGNEGFLDQVASLEWVRDNIANFGGDPNNVTIFGESAGSWSVSMLLAMPCAEGLFHRAIAQSGVMNNALSIEHATDLARETLNDLALSADDTDALLALSTDEVLAAGSSFVRGAATMAPRYHRGVIDGEVLPASVLSQVAAGSAREVDLIAGTTRDEMTLPIGDDVTDEELDVLLAGPTFGQGASALLGTYREARSKRMAGVNQSNVASAIMTDGMMRIPCIRLLEAQRTHRPVRHYIVTWSTPAGDANMKAQHGIDLGLCFGTYAVDEEHAAMFGDGPAAKALSDAVMDAWTSFARTGDPACDTLGEWPVYGDDRHTMMIGERTGVFAAPFEQERLAWQSFDNTILESAPFERTFS